MTIQRQQSRSSETPPSVAPARLVFMGSDPIALPLLESLAADASGPFELAAVCAQPDRPRGRGQRLAPNEIKSWAAGRGLPVLQPARLKRAARLELAALGPDLILVMAYGHLLSQRLIDTPPLGVWNLHASLLPRYRGASPIQGAVACGESETGVSLMRMVRQMDAGPVVDVERVPVARRDTALDVEAKLAAACVPLWARRAAALREGRAESAPQDEARASYTRKLSAADAWLDFAAPARDLARRVNALWPWPGCRVELGGQTVKVGLADWSDAPAGAPPGEILAADDKEGRLSVACGEGSAAFLRLQRPGGKMLDAAAFLRGFPARPGERIPSRPMAPLVAERPFPVGPEKGC